MKKPNAYIEHNGVMCVVSTTIIGSVFPKHKWDYWVRKVGSLQQGGHGRPALVAFDLVPEKDRATLVKLFGSPYEKTSSNLADRLKPDAEAAKFYSKLEIEPKKQAAYTASAMVLNAIDEAFEVESEARAAHGKKVGGDFWTRAVKAVNEVRYETGHTLKIKNARSLKRRFEEYKANGYSALVNGNHGKQNALKRSHSVEALIMKLYTRPERPFTSDVHIDFMAFMQGDIDLVDKATGEVFEPKNYTNADGTPLSLGATTVWNIINDPINRPVVDKLRMGHKRFNDVHRPHMDRHLPNYAFSKISMDDRDLPRQMKNNKRVKAYYAYDVLSGAVIGRSYSQTKDHALFIDCVKDMFRMMFRNGWGMPLEVEVEFHLVKEYKAELEELFPFVRWCISSQEKRAEHYNKSKKYGTEKKTQANIGRWWARSEAYQVDEDKIDNEFVGKRYEYDELVGDDLNAIEDYNDSLHHKKKRFANMSRWQVLTECMNPNLAEINKPVLMKMIGNRTSTTVRRNSRCTVNHALYEMPSVETLIKLSVNNYSVQAYWLPDEDGKVPEVHLYQGERFICTSQRRNRYNEAKGERTSEDWKVFSHQQAQTKEFDEYVKEESGKLDKVVINRIAKRDRPNIEPAEIYHTEDQEEEIEEYNSTTDLASRM